ncbi:AmiS/UreI family transporter [Actinoallomurus vinaceus]|uniref:AmiS/UreI family transporter n=1 Tax=Actinoallomurus vinaceus TaxID=1080074 RepID=A0ABP8U4K6_9ACTN
MANVGLLYVGAVLFLNGMMLLGKVAPKAAAMLNLFVGAMQVVFPTVLIATAGKDTRTILAASGLYLFGFTYLYVGIGLLTGIDTSGVGYFSLFVAVMAVGYAIVNFRILRDPPFGVIWLYWAFLWFLFFVLLGLKVEGITTYTGWVTAIEGWVTGAIPAILLLCGYWGTHTPVAVLLAVFAVVVFGGLWFMVGPGRHVRHRPGGVAAPGRP